MTSAQERKIWTDGVFFIVQVQNSQDPANPHLFYGIPGKIRRLRYVVKEDRVMLPTGNFIHVRPLNDKIRSILPMYLMLTLPRTEEIKEILTIHNPNGKTIRLYVPYLGDVSTDWILGSSCGESLSKIKKK